MKRFAIILFIALFSFSLVSSASSSDIAIVTKPTGAKGNTVRMRQEPGGKVLANIPFGTEVEVLDVQGEWMQISYDGRIGWMKSEFLSLVTPMEGTLSFDVTGEWYEWYTVGNLKYAFDRAEPVDSRFGVGRFFAEDLLVPSDGRMRSIQLNPNGQYIFDNWTDCEVYIGRNDELCICEQDGVQIASLFFVDADTMWYFGSNEYLAVYKRMPPVSTSDMATTKQLGNADKAPEAVVFVLTKKTIYGNTDEFFDTEEYNYGVDGKIVSIVYTTFFPVLDCSAGFTLTYDYKNGNHPASGSISGTSFTGDTWISSELYLYDYYGNILVIEHYDEHNILGGVYTWTYFDNNEVKSYLRRDNDSSWLEEYTYEYNGAGQKIVKRTHIQYYADGTLKSENESIVTTYEYDSNGRLIRENYEGGNVYNCHITEYDYDEHGNLISETTFQDGVITGRTEYEYMQLAEVRSVRTNVGLNTDYTSIINLYIAAIHDENFWENYTVAELNLYAIEDWIYWENGTLLYAIYDVNHDGYDELLIAGKSGEYFSIVDIYTTNGTSVIRLFGERSFGYRDELDILTNGCLYTHGSSSANNISFGIYSFSSNGFIEEMHKADYSGTETEAIKKLGQTYEDMIVDARTAYSWTILH